MSACAEAMADLQAQQRRELEAARKRLVLFALESVGHDGFPRASWYTTQTLMDLGLIEPVPEDTEGRLRLTAEGRIMLHANPAGHCDRSVPSLFDVGQAS